MVREPQRTNPTEPESGISLSRFWKLRLSTLAWGFLVSLIFTGSLVTAVPMFAVIVTGNSVLMWYFSR